MAIKLNTSMYNLQRQLVNSRLFSVSELRNVETVISYLRVIREEDFAKWIETHKYEWLRGLLEGFEIDNSQEAQLKDIHTKTADEVIRQQRVNEQNAYTGKNI